VSTRGQPLLAGEAHGPALVLDEPLSFWGGFDAGSGRIVDRRHPQAGEDARGRILAMPFGRGSSSSSSVLAEAVRLGTAPAAVLLLAPDEIVVLGLLVGEELYGRTVPVVVVDKRDFGTIRTGDSVAIRADGEVVVTAVPDRDDRPAQSEKGR
jgi:predicted aconitase with swiveling domain